MLALRFGQCSTLPLLTNPQFFISSPGPTCCGAIIWVQGMKKHYLSKVAMKHDQNAYRKFGCNAVVWVVYKRSAKHPIATCKALVKEISQGGALVVASGNEVPDHFYIVIGNNELGIGCTVVARKANRLIVEFIQEQPQRLVEAFAMLSIPMAPLFSFRGLMRNKIMQGQSANPQ